MKNKNLTFNMIESEMEQDDSLIVKYAGKNNEYEIPISYTLNFNDAMGFVHDIVDSCSNIDAGKYDPEAFDFTVRVNTLIYYAGFLTPEDIRNAYQVVYGTDLFSKVLEVIDRTQFDMLIKAAKDKLDFNRRFIIESQLSRINDLINKMDEVMKSGNDIMNTFSSGEFKNQMDDMLRLISTIDTAHTDKADVDDQPDNIVQIYGDDKE